MSTELAASYQINEWALSDRVLSVLGIVRFMFSLVILV